MKLFLSAAAFIAGLSAAAAASAQPVTTATNRSGAFSIGLGAGAIIPADVHQTLSGSAGGVPVAGSGQVSFKPGPSIEALLGYQIDEHLALEASIGYARYDFDKIEGTLTVGPTILTQARYNGDVESWRGFANALVTPLGHGTFSPYAGAGLGFVSYEAKLNSATSALGTRPLGSDTTNTDLAVDAVLGIDWAVDPQWSVGGRYQFVWSNSGRSSSAGGLTSRSDDAQFHVLELTARYRF